MQGGEDQSGAGEVSCHPGVLCCRQGTSVTHSLSPCFTSPLAPRLYFSQISSHQPPLELTAIQQGSRAGRHSFQWLLCQMHRMASRARRFEHAVLLLCLSELLLNFTPLP